MLKEKIKSVRTSNKLTQTEFAQKIGVGRSYITQLESGKTEPSQQLLNKIIQTFNISPSFFDNSKNKESSSETFFIEPTHPVFKVVQDYQKHYPEIEYYLNKLEDISAMAKKLHAPIIDDIKRVLELLSNNEIKIVYSQILAYLVEAESLKQKEGINIESNLMDIDAKVSQLNLLLISILEHAKASYESFYNLLKKWILSDLFIDEVVASEKERQINWVQDILKEKGISATRNEAEKLFNKIQSK